MSTVAEKLIANAVAITSDYTGSEAFARSYERHSDGVGGIPAWWAMLEAAADEFTAAEIKLGNDDDWMIAVSIFAELLGDATDAEQMTVIARDGNPVREKLRELAEQAWKTAPLPGSVQTGNEAGAWILAKLPKGLVDDEDVDVPDEKRFMWQFTELLDRWESEVASERVRDVVHSEAPEYADWRESYLTAAANVVELNYIADDESEDAQRA